ncbi:hypothetical protein HHK36_011413 [Tetracentron sinense]|uniref:Uncharacterized protein n=1 Tax=Tetracentron sinense TaxID=13715 RepID=A0A834ZGA4_TETSI|nr:hypothetical protein HHK36_011413 [Tetracentron sinense]
MGSPKGVYENPEGSDMIFPAGELNPGANKNFQVDPVSSQVATSKELKEQVEAVKKEKEAMEKEREKKDAAQKLKSAFIISGVIVAVIGAIFAVAKKLRET